MTIEEAIEEGNKEIKRLERELVKGVFALVLVLAGTAMIFIFYGWKLGVATLLIGWGNNIAFDGLYKKK